MADRTQLRAADHNDIADDDPFAELTRIMGFDPRQPVKPQAPAAEKAPPADQLADAGNFDIDLEKELMGEFGSGPEDGSAVAEDREPAFEAAAAKMHDELAASFEQDFLFDDAHEAAHHFTIAAAVPAPAVEADVDDFDNAAASSLEDVSPLDDDMPMDDELVASLDEGFRLDDDAADQVEHSAAADVPAPAVEAAIDDDFDHTISTSLEDELTLDDHLPVEDHLSAEDHYAGSEAVEYPAAVQAADDVDHSISDEHISGHFDQAMADVDLDFDARTAQPAEIDEPTAAEIDEPLVDETPAEAADPENEIPEHAAQQALDDDLDLDLDYTLAEPAEEPVAEPAEEPVAETAAVTVEPAAPAVVAVEPAAPAADERSLEDELNALLGAMSARPAPVVQESAPVQQPVAAVEKAAVEEVDPVRDLDWDLDEHEPSEPQRQEPVQAADTDADLDLLADALEGNDFEVEDPEPETQADAAADIKFDDDAFDAAFAKGIDLGDGAATGMVAQAAAEEETAHSLDWLRSTPPEPARSWSRVTPVPQSSFTAQPMASAQPASAAPSYRDEPVKVEDASGYAEPAPAPHGQPVQYDDEMPDVETVDVPERVVAIADDLDIPEINFEEDQPAAPPYDDLDAEFAGLLTEMNATEIAAAPARSPAYDDESYSSGFKPGYDRSETPSYAARPAEVPANAATGSYAAAASGSDMVDDLPGSKPVSQADEFAVDELDYDPELDEAMSVPGLDERDAARPRRSGLRIAAVVGAVAIAGAIGAFALSFGGKAGSEAPVIVKADNAPIKVKPENPGGTVVPNQDSKVYDAVVKGTKPAEPVQEKLVTNTEEPVDVIAKEPPQSRIVDLSPDDTDAAQGTDAAGNADVAAAPAPKSEDRIAQVLQEADNSVNPGVVAVAPRKVRTMMVKPDGSLVPREDPAAATLQTAAAEPVDPAPQHVDPTTQVDEQTGTVPLPATDQASDQASADQIGGDQAGGAQSEAAKPETASTETASPEMANTETVKLAVAAKPAAAPKAEAKSANAQSANTPATVPVAPQRPSDQPVDVVGEVKPDQVASIAATASTGGGSWSMQIASQPTVESAQSTYQDLQRRYGSVLSGRTANIVKAEIAGKGTFYRVRVPAQSRNDAINLCTSYKSAGGNCFVSR